MKYRADLAVYGADGALQLLVEAKVRRNTSPDWAKQFLRNTYAHGQLPSVPYFLLALPGQWYLWCKVNAQETGVDRSPDYIIDPHPFLQEHLARFNISSNDQLDGLTGHHSLEWVITAWLDGIVAQQIVKSPFEGLAWLKNSGLFDAITGGRVEVEAVIGA